MLPRLQELLVCPDCKSGFQVQSFISEGSNIVEGLLSCACGNIYPIANTIPRIMPDAFEKFPEWVKRHDKFIEIRPKAGQPKSDFDKIQDRTQKSFGLQWTSFTEIIEQFKNDFLNYIYPVQPSFFKDKIGLDVGCGFGRHIFYAAGFGAEMVGIDSSRAIDSVYKNVKHLNNAHLVQCDIYNLPFRDNTFDLIYSIGVLHHLPSPEKGFLKLLPLLSGKSAIFIWVYSKSRKVTVLLLEALRKITRRLPHKLLMKICFLAALIDWSLFILPYKLVIRVPVLGKAINSVAFARLKLYVKYPFFVIYTDWFDRLAAPIRFYYDGEDIKQWFQKADLKNITVSPTGAYGWRAYGER